MRTATVGSLVALCAMTVVPVASAAPTSAGGAARTSRPAAAARHQRRDLPADGPRALYRKLPRLPDPRGWPASNNAFPATSGTGRLADGAFYWTDFLYDDHGATAASPGNVAVTAGSPSFGTYTYPAGAAHNNGADIFRAAVALRRGASVWRVDWTTLARRRVPIAEWTFDRDDRSVTGGSAWPAGAGVSSAGIDTALVMSAKGAQLIDVSTGRVEHRLRVRVSMKARSFLVRIPGRWLRPAGSWRIRLATGLADSAGTGFARPPDAGATQPAVYNVGFRTRAQEPQSDDFWDDMAQTRALDNGNIGAFSAMLRWSQLRRRVRTPQARPTGWSDRWYVSSVDLGNGVLTSPDTISDGLSNYLGRVQPYAVYLPRGSHGRRLPLTFLLHSLTQNQNQYVATTPHFTQLACQQRHSICVTTLGRGPDGNYFDYAELDFWQVWHAVAATYRLDPNRTVLSGYSMGGIGSNQLAMEHPDLFARAVTLAGAVGDVAALNNLRWVPVYLAGGGEDELVPVTVERAEANRLAALGYRFRWLVFPAVDHVAYELADSFADAARYMVGARRTVNPGRFSFRWAPRNGAQSFSARGTGGGGISWTQLPRLGVGTTGDYWLRRLRARSRSKDATIVASSGGRPTRPVTPRLTHSVDPAAQPEPASVTTQTWRAGKRPARKSVIRLRLGNVRSLRLDLRAAGFHGVHRHGVVIVRSDGPVAIRFSGTSHRLAAGRHVLRF